MIQFIFKDLQFVLSFTDKCNIGISCNNYVDYNLKQFENNSEALIFRIHMHWLKSYAAVLMTLKAHWLQKDKIA